MKKLIVGMAALGVVLGLTGLAAALNTAEHTVTVTVEAINEAAITGGDLILTINTATAGQEPDDAVDNTSCDLDWTTNEDTKKITVETDLDPPTFALKVLAQNVTGVGTAAPEVTLSTTPTNFVTGVAETTGGCDLQYTASATAAQGIGSDIHTVKYTLTDGP